MIDVVALDGDDTLWHSENQFVMTQERYTELLADHVDKATLDALLLDRERANIEVFGYGVKGFTLSMIETAIEVTDGAVDTGTIRTIIDNAKEMLQHPVDLLDGVAETVKELVQDFRVMVITKGDLFHQEAKVAQCGLGDLFHRIEIVSEKDQATYRRLLEEFDLPAARFAMVGNSLRSDIEPPLSLGGWAIYMPYHVTWALELESGIDAAHPRMAQVDAPSAIPAALAELQALAATG